MNDDGLTFLATMRGAADGSMLHRETTNRFEFLSWLEVRRAAGDELLMITVEAKGPAVASMLLAVQLGAAQLLLKQQGDADIY